MASETQVVKTARKPTYVCRRKMIIFTILLSTSDVLYLCKDYLWDPDRFFNPFTVILLRNSAMITIAVPQYQKVYSLNA